MHRRLGAVFADIPVVSVSTIRNGGVVTRPMLVGPEQSAATVRFLTTRSARLIDDLAASPLACVSYTSPHYTVTLHAQARLLRCSAGMAERLWLPGLETWIPDGTAECILVELPTATATVWSSPSGAGDDISATGLPTTMLSAAEMTASYPAVTYPSRYAPSAGRYDAGGAGLLDDVYAGGDLLLSIDFLPHGGGTDLSVSGIIIATSWGRPPIYVLADNVIRLADSWFRLTQAHPVTMSGALAALTARR